MNNTSKKPVSRKKHHVARIFIFIFILLCLFFLLSAKSRANDLVWLIDIKGAVGPASADHMIRGLDQAQQAGAKLVILQIDTPGGLDTAMRQMVKAILAANIPVVGYVAPNGARAASAGTYILYATPIAAMAPATNIGAATPVQIGAPELPKIPTDNPEETETDKPPPLHPKTAMERKVINDATAYMEGLAQLHGRNTEWAIQAVREGVSLTARQALELNVINIVADDIDDLLTQLNGRTVTLSNTDIVLATENAQIYQYPIDWRSNFLSVITDPNVAYILMLIGVYGLIFEFSNPGLAVPGVLGAICILLALYAFQVLPISYAGLGLILLGIGLMSAEAFVPSFGILGAGGLIAFLIGSIILMDTELPAYQIALPVIIGFTSFSALLLILALGLVLKARRQIVVTGLNHLQGMHAIVNELNDNIARVRLEGELWQVECAQPLHVNDQVTVIAADGVVLQVEKTTGE